MACMHGIRVLRDLGGKIIPIALAGVRQQEYVGELAVQVASRIYRRLGRANREELRYVLFIDLLEQHIMDRLRVYSFQGQLIPLSKFKVHGCAATPDGGELELIIHDVELAGLYGTGADRADGRDQVIGSNQRNGST